MTKEEVRKLFGKNYIGIAELKPLFDKLGLEISNISENNISFSDFELRRAAEAGYILIYGLDKIGDTSITLKLLRKVFGVNPDVTEPCLYNQDWYMQEDFMETLLNNQWYLIKKDVLEDSRAVMPIDLMGKGVNFPSAILCGYTFFAYYFANNELLWYHDFIWCQDVDHNGDRIYVGKYHDIDGINKNGFSIHRHLALRSCYASVNLF